MFFFSKNKTSSAEEMQNWYQDRYMSVAIQRNFLLVFSLFIASSLLLCLLAIKHLQEGKGGDPYLIEYDKKTGFMTIVETKSKKEYTAQQAVKESMLIQYIYHREAPKLTTIEDDMNYIRVSTSAKIYSSYTSSVAKEIRELRDAGQNARYDLKVVSILYLAANRVQITLKKKLIVDDKEVDETTKKIVISFGFSDIEMPIEDMRINPLGFQVSYYQSTPIKEFKSTIINSDSLQQTEPSDGQSNRSDDNNGNNNVDSERSANAG